jgi:predicted transcriptional regulator
MIKLFDAELKLMEIVWENGDLSAKQISIIAAGKYGWNKNTTYTVIKRLTEKGALTREEPGFICVPSFCKEDLQKTETKSLIDKFFNGSKSAFFSAFAGEKLTPDEIEALRTLIEKKG